MLRIFLSLYFLSLGTVIAQTDPSFRVMSFNIRLNVASDSSNAWPFRTKLVESMIRFHNVDLLGVQEALPDQMEDLKQMLPEFAVHGVARDTGRWGEYSAIFYRQTRFEKLDGSTFWLSPTPEIPSRGWDAALNRIVSWATFRDKRTGKKFLYFNTHFDHRGIQARSESARLIVQQIERLNPENLPVLLSGDFNTTPASEPYEILTGAMTDAASVSVLAAHGPTSTWSGFRFPGEPNRRIDYIFLQGAVTVLKYATLSESWSGRYPSDHLPVWVEVWVAPDEVLPSAHAHNDYAHTRPLFDALESGFMSVEADIWLIDQELYVSHDKPLHPKPSRSLTNLYLEPLAVWVDQHHGRVYPQSAEPFYLMIDIKANGEAVYPILKKQLQPYRHLLTGSNPPLKIFVSGDRPIELIAADPDRWMGIDGRPEDLGKDYPAALMPVISQRYGALVSWKGKEPISEREKEILVQLCQRAHAEGKKVRLWASPENELVWQTLLECGLDLINTDHLMEYRIFRLDQLNK